VAFDAWLATDPFTNAKAPPGPTYMAEYKQPELAVASALDTTATEDYTLGVQAGSNADNYIRDTIPSPRSSSSSGSAAISAFFVSAWASWH
jgi:hypothetical protein